MTRRAHHPAVKKPASRPAGQARARESWWILEDRHVPQFQGPHPMPRFDRDEVTAGGAPAAPPSVEMPTAVTELSVLLAEDGAVCAQRPTEQAAPEKPTTAEPAATQQPPPLPGDECEMDLSLARVVDAWPRLPRSVQTAVLTMIEAMADGGK